MIGYSCSLYEKATSKLSKKYNVNYGKMQLFQIYQILAITGNFDPKKNIKQHIQIFNNLIIKQNNAKLHDNYISTIPKLNKQVITTYTNNLYTVINKYLRTGKVNLSRFAHLVNYTELNTLIKIIKKPKKINNLLSILKKPKDKNMNMNNHQDLLIETTQKILKSKSGIKFYMKLFEKFVHILNKTIRQAPRINESFYIFRGMNKTPTNINTNEYVSRKGILSWSIDPRIAIEFGDYIQVVKVPVQFPCLIIRSISEYKEEQEILLPISTMYKKKATSSRIISKQSLSTTAKDFCKNHKSSLSFTLYETNLNVKLNNVNAQTW